MPIEFRCTTCQRLLRTADNTAGKQTKCPQCGTILAIPGAVVDPFAQFPTSSSGTQSPFASPPPTQNSLGSPVDQGGLGSPFASQASEANFTAGGPDAGQGNPYASPHSTTSPYAGAPTLDIGRVMQSAWTIYTTRFAECLLSALIVMGMNLAGVLVIGGLIFLGVFLTALGLQNAGDAAPIAATAVGLVLAVPLLLYMSWLFAGHSIFMLKLARGQPTAYSDLFTGAAYMGRFLIAWLVIGIAISVGCVACIVPGVLLWMICIQYQWLIVDRNLSVGEALSQSNQLSVGNKGTLFVMLLLIVGIWFVTAIVGYVIPIIPQLFVMPFVVLLLAVSYLHASGQRSADMLPQR